MMPHMPNMLCTIHFEACMMRHQTIIGSYMTNTDCLVVQSDRDTSDYLCYVVRVQLHIRYAGEPSKDDSHLRLCLIGAGSRVSMNQMYIYDYGGIYCYDVDQIFTEVVYSMLIRMLIVVKSNLHDEIHVNICHNSADMCVVYLDDYGCIYFSDVDQIVNEGVHSMIMRMLIVVNLNLHDEIQGIIHHNLVDMFSVCSSD